MIIKVPITADDIDAIVDLLLCVNQNKREISPLVFPHDTHWSFDYTRFSIRDPTVNIVLR
jgi:hypothetical protein